MIDLEKQNKEFEKWVKDECPQIQCELNSKTDGDYDSGSMSWAWASWKHKQAEIDSLKAQQKLDKPARVGGAVFREGVAWETIIECAQRHYDYGQRDTQPTPLISPSDAIKLAAGELVLVPKEPTEAMIKHAYGTYEGANILPYSFYKAMIEAAQENSHE